MKILFVVDTSGARMNREPLGLMQISALLKQHGHVCGALDLAEETDLVAAVRERDPQLLAFSAISGLHRRLVCASQKIMKKLDVLSIFGGPHPTYFPEMIEEEGVDVICRGEGEYPMLELVETMEAGRDFATIPNLWVKRDGQIHRNQLRPFVHDLDDLPWPDRELFNAFSQLHAGDARSFMGGRGCPYDCTFCFNHVARKLAQGRYVRWRSVENLVGELKAVKERYGMRFVSFHDDIFVLRIDWLEELSARYRREIGLPFLCNVRADLVTDHVSQVLASAGCAYAVMGLEAGNDHIRTAVLNKNISQAQFTNACRSLRAHGIKVVTQNMFGLPFETIDSALDTVGLNVICQPYWANVHFYVPYPRTQLSELAVEEGFFQAMDMESIPEGFTTELSSVNLILPEGRQIEQLARLTNLCIRVPLFYPLVRFLFKHQEGNWVNTSILRILLLLRGMYVRITRRLGLAPLRWS